MIKYILKRLILAIITLIAIVTITFILMNLIPGGPFAANKIADENAKRIIMEKYNLDKPLYVQYFLYIKNLLHGDFGVSLRNQRVIKDVILSTSIKSAKIAGATCIVSIIIGVILGIISALFKDTFIDGFINIASTIIISIPEFVLAAMLLYVICVVFKLIPVWTPVKDHFILPVISLSIPPIAVIIKYMRSSMIDVMSENYIKTARAKGVPEAKVVCAHALKNAIAPIITYLGTLVSGLIMGTIVVEQIFTISGIGAEFLKSIQNKDYPMILGITIFFSTIVVLVNLLSDILYKIIDPRISFD